MILQGVSGERRLLGCHSIGLVAFATRVFLGIEMGKEKERVSSLYALYIVSVFRESLCKYHIFKFLSHVKNKAKF